jgi:hypothetical protein
VQRRADDPATVIRLARSQERELREWLYADQNRSTDSLASSVTAVAHDVEDEQGIPIEVVVTGDRPMDEGGQALVKATREALLNAVRHGEVPVSVYVEIGPSGVEAFVRDHGPGFEMTDIGDDRLGVRESILGRMRRHGGAATDPPPRVRYRDRADPAPAVRCGRGGGGTGAGRRSTGGGEPSETAPTESAAESRQAQPTGGRTA